MIDLNEIRPEVVLEEAPPAKAEEMGNETEEGGHSPEVPRAKEAEPAAVSQPDSKLAALRKRCLALAVERDLALALSGEALIPGVSDQLVKLLKDRLLAEESEEQEFRVRSRDGRPVAEAVKDWLGSPEYRHFLAPVSRGGVLRKTESTMNAGTSANPSEAPGRSLNELVIERWKNRVRSRPKEGLWPGIP